LEVFTLYNSVIEVCSHHLINIQGIEMQVLRLYLWVGVMRFRLSVRAWSSKKLLSFLASLKTFLLSQLAKYVVGLFGVCAFTVIATWAIVLYVFTKNIPLMFGLAFGSALAVTIMFARERSRLNLSLQQLLLEQLDEHPAVMPLAYVYALSFSWVTVFYLIVAETSREKRDKKAI
jgi:hypothetical protein